MEPHSLVALLVEVVVACRGLAQQESALAQRWQAELAPALAAHQRAWSPPSGAPALLLRRGAAGVEIRRLRVVGWRAGALLLVDEEGGPPVVLNLDLDEPLDPPQQLIPGPLLPALEAALAAVR
jgi:hypothetical protein